MRRPKARQVATPATAPATSERYRMERPTGGGSYWEIIDSQAERPTRSLICTAETKNAELIAKALNHYYDYQRTSF